MAGGRDIFGTARGRSGDQQEGVKRGVWGERTNSATGAYMSVRGTGTVDEEVPIMNMGYSFNLDPNANAEVVMLALSSDPNDKVAVPMLPRNLQYQWPVGSGGVQHPTDPERRIEFNGQETWLKDGTFVVGSNREVTIRVDGSNVTITTGGNATVEAGGTIDLNAGGAVSINSPSLNHNGTNIGDDHVHGGVDPGTANTDGPE